MSDGLKILLGALGGAIVVLLFVPVLGGAGMMGGMGSMMSGSMTHREGTEYRPPSSSLLRVITRGRRGPPGSRSLVGVLLVLGLIFGRR